MGVYFILSGAFRYTPDFTDTGDDENINVSEWLCEACLWTPWVHLGLLQAQTKATYLFIDSPKFREVVRSSRSGVMIPSKYAMLFIKHLNSTVKEGYNLSDREIPGFDAEDACKVTYANPDHTEPETLEDVVAADNTQLLGDRSPASVSFSAYEADPLTPDSSNSPLGWNGRNAPSSEETSTMHVL